MTRIYTRTGDQGTTRLAGGQEVPKDDARVAAYGTVDELTTVLGVVRAFLPSSPAPAAARERLDRTLDDLQRDLFWVAAGLATLPADRPAGMPAPGPSDVERLERCIDDLELDLAPLEAFILPAGGAVPTHLHQARTVSRRAERAMVGLVRAGGADAAAFLPYVNRLADLLFVLARWAAHAEGTPETPWRP
jgi:cob(I)alamin adenosyltransferase